MGRCERLPNLPLQWGRPLAEAETLTPKHDTQTGEADRAFNLLEQVTKIPFGVTYGSLKLDEVWDPLRSDARFEKIVASLAPKM